MEVKNRLNAFELQPVVEKICKISDQPTRWNLRLVSKLWKQEVDQYDIRSYKRKVFTIPEVFAGVVQYLNLPERTSLSLSCTTLYCNMSDVGSCEQDMIKYKEKRQTVTENKMSNLAYYYRNVNKIKYFSSLVLGTCGFGSVGLTAYTPLSIYQMIFNKQKLVTVDQYTQINSLLQEHGEETTKQILDLFSGIGKGLNIKEAETVVESAKETVHALLSTYSAEKLPFQDIINIIYADDKSGALARFLIANKYSVFFGTAIMGAVALAIKYNHLSKRAFAPDWDQHNQEFKRTATIKIPNEVLEKFGIPPNLLPPFPVFCSCTFLDDNLEMKFFVNEEEEMECNKGGHLISLEDSKFDVTAKVCSDTGLEITKKSHIPLVTVLINLQREETKKALFS